MKLLPAPTNEIDVNYKVLKSEIAHWKNIIQKNDKLYDVAFFKIFVKFEGFLITVFKVYVSGNYSAQFKPERRLNFEDIEHFEKIVKSNGKSSYVDYLNLIEEFSRQVFVTNRNPFDCVFNDANINDVYKKMRLVRNHIAHESDESRVKYVRTVISNQSYIEVNDFLKKRVSKKKSYSNFTEYINCIEDVCKILINPSPFF